MKDINLVELLFQVDTQILWSELARRYRIKYGRLEKLFHDGKPSEYTSIELKQKENLDLNEMTWQ